MTEWNNLFICLYVTQQNQQRRETSNILQQKNLTPALPFIYQNNIQTRTFKNNTVVK